MVQTIHNIFISIRLLQSLFAVHGAAFRVLVSVILRDPLGTGSLRVLDLHSVHYLFFDDIQNSRDDSCLELLRIDLCLLNVLSPQDQLESVLDLRFCSARYDICDLTPLIAKFKPLLKELLVLPERPLALLDGWVECGEPPLAALFAVPGGQDHPVAVLV